MKIDNLRDLKKLIQLCRDQGVDSITVDGITVQLGMEPIKAQRSSKSSKIALPNNLPKAPDEIATEGLTQEQMLYYSAVPHGEIGEHYEG